MANTYRINYFLEETQNLGKDGTRRTSHNQLSHQQAFVSAASGDSDTIKSVLNSNGITAGSGQTLMVSQVGNADLGASRGAPVLS